MYRRRDLCSKISFILAIDEKTVITCNEQKFIKIWKETFKKPKLLLIENNQDYNFEEGYESEKETQGNFIFPEGNENENNQSTNNEKETENDFNEISNEIEKTDNENNKNKENNEDSDALIKNRKRK